MIVGGDVGHDGTFVRLRSSMDILGIQHTRNIKMLLCDIKGQVQIVYIITLQERNRNQQNLFGDTYKPSLSYRSLSILVCDDE